MVFSCDTDQLRLDDGQRDSSFSEFVDAFEFETCTFDCRASVAIEVTAVVDRFPQRVEPVLPPRKTCLVSAHMLEHQEPTVLTKDTLRLMQGRFRIGNSAQRQCEHHGVEALGRKWARE